MAKDAGYQVQRRDAYAKVAPSQRKVRNCRSKRLRSDTYIFVPKHWMLADEFCHKLNAFCILEHLDVDTPRAEKFLFA